MSGDYSEKSSVGRQSPTRLINKAIRQLNDNKYMVEDELKDLHSSIIKYLLIGLDIKGL